jgi:chromosome segregation ATPase
MNRSILSSPGLGGDAEYERVVEGMRDEIETLKKQLDLSQKKETELAHLIDEKEASFKKELIQVERNARHRYEEAQDEYEKQLTQIKGKLSQMSDELLTVCNERDELSKLRDEMDIMKHTKATLEETQERLNAYKERVHQLADIKSALKEEEEAHSRCVEDNLKLRNEIQTLLPLKKQLEEYQSRLADAEVQMTDYEDQLAKFKDQRLSSSDINEQMEQYVLAQEEELQELRRRVRLGEVSTESKESISFIGEGLSELNPELREELMKLRNDNEQLRLFREKRGDDNVSKLEQEVGDKTRLAERYKTQFLSTKDQLESTQRSLQDSRGREAKLRSDLAESLKKVQEAQGEVEDLSSQLHKVNEELSSSQQRESKLEDELSSWASEAKHLQEHSNDLSRRLKRHEDLLEDSLKREKGLATELDQVKAELEETIEENEALTEELEERTVQLQSSEKRENELSIDLKEWTKRAQESHDHMKEISAQLVQSSNDLKIVKEERSNIEARFTLFKEEAEEQISKLSEELRSTSTMLQETQKNIEDAKNREMSLQNEIADLTCRAEDAEGVSKQRMELLHTTREKLQSVESKLEEFEKIHQQTLASLASWTSRSKEAESKIRVLDDEIEELRRTSLDTEEKLAESQALSDHLRGEIVTLSQEKEDAMKQAGEAQALVDRLRVEVGETTNNLLQAREELKNLQLSEAKLTEQLYDTEKTLGNLENEIESQVAVREEVTKKFDTLKCEHAQLSEKWANEKKALSEDLESQRDQRNKLENELASANETLSELHVTLGSLHHREKMLKHDISKLTHKQQETEKKLSETESELLQVKEESAKSIENLEELLVTQSEEVIRKLKDNMNKLVEDERILKRQAEELYKHRLEEAHQEHQKSLDSVENKWREKIDHLRKETDTKINRMKAEYEDMIVELKKAAEEEKMSLMDQGKAMLKENKTKIQNLSDDVEYLESKILDLEEEKKKIVEGNERIGKQFQLKMGEYKKKLQEAASRNKILASNQDELKDKVTSLSREKIKLLEENDRYRRQLGGRSGTDSVLQSQLESVQKELYDADEENKELKRKLRNNGYNGLSSISEESTGYGLRSGAKHSTLAQQRAEYEETIMTLKDEMRGHVMEKTALITAAQAESKRAWEAEQQVSDLKKQATSLLLEKARLEKLIENRCPEDKKLDFASYPTIPEPPSQGNDNDSDDGGIGQHRADKSLSMLRSKTSMDDLPEKYAVAEQNEDDNDDENNQKLPFKSNIDTIKNVRSTRSLNSEPNNDWM